MTLRGSFVYTNGMQFDGATQYARRTGGGTNVIDNFSMVIWAKVVGYAGGSTYIFHNGANDARGFALYMSSAGVLHADYAFVADVNSAFTLQIGSWYQLALIRTSGVSQLYVNAVAQGATIANAPNTGGDFITVGAWTTSGGVTSGFFNGIVDEGRLYERAISPAELQQLYNRAFDITQPDISSANLFYWYKFDESSGDPADSSGNAKNLTNFGTAPYVAGKIPSAMYTPSSFVINVNRPRPLAPGIAR